MSCQHRRRYREDEVNGSVERGLIFLDDHQIVAMLSADLARNRLLGQQGIHRRDRPRQVTVLEQERDSRDLIALVLDADLGAHEGTGMGDQAHEMDLGAMPLRSTDGFAIDSLPLPGSSGRRRNDRERLTELGQARLQGSDIEGAERAAQGGSAGEAVVVNPLTDGAAGALAAKEGGADQGEKDGPSM